MVPIVRPYTIWQSGIKYNIVPEWQPHLPVMEANEGWADSIKMFEQQDIPTTEIENLKAIREKLRKQCGEKDRMIENLKVENANLEKDRMIENLKVENVNLKAKLTSTLPLIEDTFNSLADKLTHSLTHSLTHTLESHLSSREKSPIEEYDEWKMDK